MGQSAPLFLARSTFLAILLLAAALCKDDDDLSKACSAIFHKTTPNGESLGFRFSYSGGNRFRQLLTGELVESIRETVQLPAPGDGSSSGIPSFSCVLVFTASPGTHRSQDTRMLIRVSNLHLGSGPFVCDHASDAVRVYNVFSGRLFLVREFCGNDTYSPAIITESHMAVVTISFSLGEETRRFHLNVEAYKNIFKTVRATTSSMTYVPDIENLNMYDLTQPQNEKQDYEWSKFSEWEKPLDNGNVWANAKSNGVDDWNVYISNERWKRLAVPVNKTEKS